MNQSINQLYFTRVMKKTRSRFTSGLRLRGNIRSISPRSRTSGHSVNLIKGKNNKGAFGHSVNLIKGKNKDGIRSISSRARTRGHSVNLTKGKNKEGIRSISSRARTRGHWRVNKSPVGSVYSEWAEHRSLWSVSPRSTQNKN